MHQKPSAMTYIRNNKRRVSVLIVSLTLCAVLIYLTQFLLSSTIETFRPMLLENTLKCHFISLPDDALGAGGQEALAETLQEQPGILNTFCTQVLNYAITPAVGTMSYAIPLTEKENVSVFMEHFNAVLKDGRMPEAPGEIVLDEASMKNNGFELGGWFNEDRYQQTFMIVGVLECDTYFGCGIKVESDYYTPIVCALSDGSIRDMSALLHSLGYRFEEFNVPIMDYVSGEEFFKDEIIDAIKPSQTIVFTAVFILLFISLYIVYSMYLRDRHNEWCLYCSIGFSRMDIYRSILHELIFTFVTALTAAAVIIALCVPLLDALMITPLGLKCRYFDLETVGQILCVCVLLFGILQIPVRFALHKVRTIDAIEDDLY